MAGDRIDAEGFKVTCRRDRGRTQLKKRYGEGKAENRKARAPR